MKLAAGVCTFSNASPCIRKLLEITSRVVRQAERFSNEIASGVKRSSDVLSQAVLDGLRRELDSMVETLEKVVRQTKARVFGGDTHVTGKILSVFETASEVIRKGKASKPTEFGKMVRSRKPRIRSSSTSMFMTRSPAIATC